MAEAKGFFTDTSICIGCKACEVACKEWNQLQGDTPTFLADTCNGCRNCISACPYGVIGFNESTGTAHKCTLCYDRLQAGMTPACAQACPTQSIQFGNLTDLQAAADKRLAQVHQSGVGSAQL